MNTKQIYPILETMLWELFFFLSAIKKAFQKKDSNSYFSYFIILICMYTLTILSLWLFMKSLIWP